MTGLTVSTSPIYPIVPSTLTQLSDKLLRKVSVMRRTGVTQTPAFGQVVILGFGRMARYNGPTDIKRLESVSSRPVLPVNEF